MLKINKCFHSILASQPFRYNCAEFRHNDHYCQRQRNSTINPQQNYTPQSSLKTVDIEECNFVKDCTVRVGVLSKLDPKKGNFKRFQKGIIGDLVAYVC